MIRKITFVCAFAVALTLASCSDWIDVSPKTEVESADLFTSESGFKNALIGVYARMTLEETYGRQMTFGYLERLVQRYDVGGVIYDEVQAARYYDYENYDDSKNAQATIWANLYTTITNINNLLGYIETNGQYITTDGYYNLIKGEALGLRAFHYFDLLRMWGPVYSQDPTATAVPWRETVSTELIAPAPANELVEHILDDLHQADSLLVDDPMELEANVTEPFIGDRQYRMNKFAVKALLARVYLWIGDKENAALYAGQVIDGCGLSLVSDNTDDVSMKGETLFGLKKDNMEEDFSGYWPTETPYQSVTYLLMRQDTWEQTFETLGEGVNDIRGVRNKGCAYDGTYYVCRKYMGDEDNESEGFYENIPLIRLSEMYYIMAECVALGEGNEYLNNVRNARGISRSHNLPAFTREQERLDALQSEYSKDFYAEGQYFFFLKRNNCATFYRCPSSIDMRNYYVFPIPDDEREYGLVDVKDDDEENNEN